MSRRREPGDDAPGEEREEQRRFWNSPAGWAISAVAAAVFIALSLLEPLLGLGIATILAVAELVDQARRRKPWLVEATASGLQSGLAWRVGGRRRSGQVVDEVARALERGQTGIDPPGAERL
ncbi:MAG: hypothetical protein ACRDMU_11100 [Gaiellaceae bacterium]